MKNILAKLHNIQSEVERMGKDGYNDFQHYNYLSETQVTIKMKELLDKHKVMFVPLKTKVKRMTEISPTSKGTKQYITTVRMKYMFADIETGEFIEGVMDGQGADTGDKGIYKGITGAAKYVFMKTFNIPTGDDPERTKEKNQGGSPASNTTPTHNTSNTTIVSHDQPESRFCTVHNKEMKPAMSLKTNQWYWSHYDAEQGTCFGTAYMKRK